MQAVIFGASGQDGKLLTSFLTERGVNVIGVSRTGSDVSGDVACKELVDSVIQLHSPDYIFHFAATSATRHSVLYDNHTAICTGTLNILESVSQNVPKARVFLAGSALQFNNIGQPIDENTPFEATSPYALARIHSTFAARYYRQHLNLDVYVGYLFHHDSIYRSEAHVNQKIALAAKRIAAGSQEILTLGNIDVQKEFNYAGDIIEAMWTIVNQSDHFEIVVGSGRDYAIRDWVQCCFEIVGLDWQKHVKITSDFQPEYRRLVSDPRRLFRLGWKPKVSLRQLAEMMVAE